MHLSNRAADCKFPPFPTDIIQGTARKFIDLYSPIRVAPEAFLWLAFITYFGNAVSPYVRLDSASSEPRIYGAVIGQSARTRKSSGNSAARNLFRQVGRQRIIEGFGSAEGLLDTLGCKDDPSPVIIDLDELNLLASKTDIKGSAGIVAFNKLFEDHDYDHPLAKRQGYIVRNAYLSMLGASTLEDFTKAWTAKHEDAGFFNRLLTVAADSNKRIPRPVDPEAAAVKELATEVRNIIDNLRAAPKTLTLEPEAERLWGRFYDEAFGDGPEWGRIDTYGARLMTLQTVLEGKSSVTKEIVQQVLDFLNYEVAVRQAVAPVVADNAGAEMEGLIRKYLPVGETITRRELQRRTNAYRKGIEVFDRAASNMASNGELGVSREGKTTLYTRLE